MTAARPVRAVVYGVGAMGAILARLLVEKGCEIVGAVARSPEKVGRDLGEVASLGYELGVVVDDDPARVLDAARADVAVVAVASYLSVMFEHFAACLERGVNVVTIEEEAVYPWSTAPQVAGELDRIAKAGNATLAASGAQDVFWMHLVGCLLGAAHRIDSVRGRCSWNADDYGPEVARHVHLGDSRAEFERRIAQDGWPDFVVRATLEALVADAGFTPARVRPAVTPVIAQEPVRSKSLGRVVAPGEVLGVVDSVSIETAEGPTFSFEMAGRVYGEGESDTNHWVVAGDPPLELRNDCVPTRLITCTSVVNRIPDVIAAPSGLVTLDRLPRSRYRPGPYLL